jgi:hypothetical protein
MDSTPSVRKPSQQYMDSAAVRATASVLVAMLAQVSGHRYGIERYGTTGPEIRRVMSRLLFTGITGRKPPT